MALSMEQELALFEILEVPHSSTGVHKLQPDDNLTAIAVTADNLATQAYTLIQTKITEIEANAPKLVVLQGYLDTWIALGTNVTTMDDGGFEGIAGLNDDPDRERIVLRGRVLTIVPYYRLHSELQGTLNRNISIDICR